VSGKGQSVFLTQCLDLLSQGLDLLTQGLDLLSQGLDLLSQGLDSLSQGLELEKNITMSFPSHRMIQTRASHLLFDILLILAVAYHVV
jgi:hypothetical protein